jgi:hypothetical protein
MVDEKPKVTEQDCGRMPVAECRAIFEQASGKPHVPDGT